MRLDDGKLVTDEIDLDHIPNEASYRPRPFLDPIDIFGRNIERFAALSINDLRKYVSTYIFKVDAAQNAHKRLFFDVTISPFKALSNDNTIVKARYRRLISEKGKSEFLGVRHCLNDKGVPTDHIFFNTHQNAYHLANLLFECITGTKGECIRHHHNYSQSWAMFLIGAPKADEAAQEEEYVVYSKNIYMPHQVSLTDIRQPEIEPSKNKRESLFLQESKAPQAETFAKEIDNFELVIGVQNGYDLSDDLIFYAIIKHKDYEESQYLTIASFKFSTPDKLAYATTNNSKELERIIKENATNKFLGAIYNFKKLYSLLRNKKWEGLRKEQAFAAVFLDIKDKNRSKTSNDTDDGLKAEIDRDVRSADDFLLKRPYADREDFAMLIDFIIYNNRFALHTFGTNRERYEAVLVQKDTYKNVENRLQKLIQNDEVLYPYLHDQIQTLKKLNA